jgi:pimeloyl-ACP methyl ester carboxylesterase
MAEDARALMDHLGLARAVVGGISMGAAVALNFALRFPERAAGLVLSRPAWLDAPRPENTRVFAEIAKLLRERGAKEGMEAFRKSDVYAELRRESPDCAISACGQFLEPRAVEAVVRLEQIPWDKPCESRDEWRRLGMPVLVMANRLDPIHPFEYGEILAGLIPGAEFGELTPKSVSVEAYQRDNQRHLARFLTAHFCNPTQAPPDFSQAGTHSIL